MYFVCVQPPCRHLYDYNPFLGRTISQCICANRRLLFPHLWCTLIMRQPEKCCMFQRIPPSTRVFAWPTIFGTSITFPMKKLRKSFKKRVRMRSPVRHHFGEHFSKFWFHFAPQLAPEIIPEAVLKGSKIWLKKWKGPKQEKIYQQDPYPSSTNHFRGGRGPRGRVGKG